MFDLVEMEHGDVSPFALGGHTAVMEGKMLRQAAGLDMHRVFHGEVAGGFHKFGNSLMFSPAPHSI